MMRNKPSYRRTILKSLFHLLAALLLSALVVVSGATSAQASTIGSTDSGTTVSQPPIMDEGSMFSPEQEAALTDVIVANHAKYGLFFAIETIPSLNGQVLEAVSLARANELGVGEADKDNGVFILLSREDRKIRFELGKGVTGKVSDAEMTNIIASQVSPHFKMEAYPAGLEAGMTAVGEKYIGVAPTASNNSPWLVPSLLIAVAIPVFFFLMAVLYSRFGKEPRRVRREERERKESHARLDTLNTFSHGFKRARGEEIDKYKALPDEKTRLDFLKTNHPEIAATLQKHYSSETPSTQIIDRFFYDDTNSFTNSFFSDYSEKSFSNSVRKYKLTGKGFENIAINEANNHIQIVKDKYLKSLEKERKKKERARKVWNSIPEPTQKALKKAKTQSDRLALLAGEGASGFASNYALIASMFLSSGSSGSGSGSSSRSSGSSSSSRSSSGFSSYDSGSYGGGSFDGGGGSGSW
jgi:uncharacterized membrane protein YgcG